MEPGVRFIAFPHQEEAFSISEANLLQKVEALTGKADAPRVI